MRSRSPFTGLSYRSLACNLKERFGKLRDPLPCMLMPMGIGASSVPLNFTMAKRSQVRPFRLKFAKAPSTLIPVLSAESPS